jgi:hypothetical protein
MYNPDVLITSKEEKMELPQSPVFYEEDYPWKPFKSNGGTGDIPPNWTEPSTTVERELKPIQPKFCPFRKHIWFADSHCDYTVPQYANHMEEEFQPCLRERCGVWSTAGLRCGLIYVRP